MEQFEKVCKGLECCYMDKSPKHCKGCPYNMVDEGCGHDIFALERDALALILQQQERIKELEAAQQWISVKDRLPEGKTNPVTLDFNEVICFCDFGGDPKRTDVRTYKFGTRLGDTKPHFWHGPKIMDGVVTHWQYLPEPPKEG